MYQRVFNQRPLLALTILYISYFSVLSIGLYYFNHWQLNRQLNQSVIANSNILSNQSLPKIPQKFIDNSYTWHIYDAQGLLQWKHGSEILPFEQINFESIRRFQSPSIIQTSFSGKWVLNAKIVYSQGSPIGAIIIGHNLQGSSDNDFDSKLIHESMANISAQLQLDNQAPAFSSQIIIPDIEGIILIDRFGVITYCQGFLPLTIDLSNLKSIWKNTSQTITSKNHTYQTTSKPFTFQNQDFLLVGTLIKPAIQLQLSGIFRTASIASLIFVGLISLLFFRNKPTPSSLTHQLVFIKDSGILRNSNQQITFPFNTNQYFLLRLLIKKPTQWFETDQLADEIYGETSSPQDYLRSIYDAARLINKKAQIAWKLELIDINNKRYRLNPDIKIESQ